MLTLCVTCSRCTDDAVVSFGIDVTDADVTVVVNVTVVSDSVDDAKMACGEKMVYCH